ncbi:E3 ubiquitin-protein ligase Topors isoform X3 [Amborella trichopoda]|uniref:E3 ubiquitin-protein ligase Topors isoform X3 n=1 Tax=Amborella trichopoda TaxID=13333 RepID=UPI0009BF59AD|nr:E3 ubiquitin-protein ligase Topors isoform X3 [Amborella trichopoda]|eukprot:XP_020529835.1 E3 ubiquitin-protein ligase Topors isoform X3 [Amborella trichopoda]
MEPSSSKSNFRWLPSLKVWAYSPEQSSSSSSSSSLSSSSVRVSNSRKLRMNNWIRISKALQQKTCPICLGCTEESEAAVLQSCMHVYCIGCIRKWSEMRRNCPLCKSEFKGWFCNIRTSRVGDYREEFLLPLKGAKEHDHGHHQWVTMPAFNQRHSRPLPWRRSFGRSRFVPPIERQRREAEVIAERVLRWRASIYERGLRAVPLCFPSKPSLQQKLLENNGQKERIQRRVEPWIRRELEAILGDSDPSVLVHLVSSLWMSSLEEELKATKDSTVVKSKFVQQLRPFLHERADMFWHELRCFAESPFTLATYDSVVEYRRL